MDERQAAKLRTAGGTLLALTLLPVGWYAVALVFLWIGRALGGGTEPMEDLVRVSWFVGPPVGGFVGLWAAGVLVRGADLRKLFLGFAAFVTAMFLIALAGFFFGGGFTEATFTTGMVAQLALVLAGAWLGRRAAEKARAKGA